MLYCMTDPIVTLSRFTYPRGYETPKYLVLWGQGTTSWSRSAPSAVDSLVPHRASAPCVWKRCFGAIVKWVPSTPNYWWSTLNMQAEISVYTTAPFFIIYNSKEAWWVGGFCPVSAYPFNLIILTKNHLDFLRKFRYSDGLKKCHD